MSLSADNYAPQVINAGARKKKGWLIWLSCIFFVSVWLGAIIAAPAAKANDLTALSASVYSFYSYLCHQNPARSFHLLGEPFAVCSRCFGVYFGILAGLIAYPVFRRIDQVEPLPRIWLILSTFPIAIDWALSFFGLWENNHASRFITGAILGAACAFYAVPAFIEISNWLSRKKSAHK
jgi:uncharacterized membrane protein